MSSATERLDYLRGEIEGERDLSMGELMELEHLGIMGLIDDGDVTLLEWAGVPEFGCRAWLIGEDGGAEGYCELEEDEHVADEHRYRIAHRYESQAGQVYGPNGKVTL